LTKVTKQLVDSREERSMTITDKMRENLNRYNSTAAQIRSDWTRSDEAKRQDLERLYSEARSTHARLEDEYRAGIRNRLNETRRAALSAPSIPGSDKALQLMAYRDALERTSRTTDQRTLSEMLARAEITGDAPLARAVLWRGYELQNENLVHSYFEKYPEELPAWNAFMDAATEQNRLEQRGVTLAAGVPEPERPQELGYTPVGDRT
jgi:hypothetical protein